MRQARKTMEHAGYGVTADALIRRIHAIEHLRQQQQALDAAIAARLADLATLDAAITHMRRWLDARRRHEGA